MNYQLPCDCSEVIVANLWCRSGSPVAQWKKAVCRFALLTYSPLPDCTPMADSPSLRDRYLELIDQIVQTTLKGNIRSKEQVYQLLVQSVEPGTGEVLERCLGDRVESTQQQASQADELKQAKATRILRALQTIQGEWQRWQAHNQATESLSSAVRQIASAPEAEQLTALLSVLDPNRNPPLNLAQWSQLSTLLRTTSAPSSHPEAQTTAVQDMAEGIRRGLESWTRLEGHLVSWMYDQSREQLGFGGVPGQQGPWALWAKQVNSPVPQELFQTLATDQSAVEWVERRRQFDASDVVELAVLLRCLQQGLVSWFDQLVYDAKVGAKLSISTFLGFSVIWSQLANGFNQASTVNLSWSRFTDACFQITLQILRTFSQREYFPLYGGIFASFSGKYLRGALDYLSEPLQRSEGTQEKARILTLLGYSFRVQGQIERAIAFHQQALKMARQADDRPCEIANLNHLSRTYAAQEHYGEAIDTSQRALILSRQVGDRLGEANALASLGYGEVFQAQSLEHAEAEVYERAIYYLEQGLELAEKVGDRQSQALCLSSLGIAQVALEQYQEAIAPLQRGVQAAQFSGDLYLQGINLVYLAEAHHRLQNPGQTLSTACLGMYLLEQIGSASWRQPAGLLTILKGQLGEGAFQDLLLQQRPSIIAVIGVDGYDHLPDLLEFYQAE